MFSKQPGYALVFSGGGAKGAYEIGAWKAIRELKIKIDAVGGTSVGALNAAVVAQDDFDLGIKIWSELTIDKVVDIPSQMLSGGKPKFSFKNLMKIGDLHLDIKNLGLDSSPLHNMLKAEVDEEKIRSSGIDLGIVTVKVDNFSPCEIFLDDMPHGTLPDYLLASASFPAFKRAEINGKHFADGAMYDNVPHAMMKNRGYRRIIVVDIGGVGVNRKPDIAGTETIYIRTSVPLGNVLDFNPKNAIRAIDAGYLDTMKVFGKNDGLKYYINKNSKLEKELYDRLLNQNNIDKYSKYLKLNGRKAVPENVGTLIREILPKEQRSNRDLILCLIEAAAASLDIERIKLYKLSELLDAIKEKYAEINRSGNLPSEKESESFLKMIEETIEGTLSFFRSDRGLSKYSSYEYAKMMKNRQAAFRLLPEILPAEVLLSLIT
ncbi:MAG: patatin-like phospholipase family protein [Spirochaetales bacterium]|uniref:Patatin-like phospholipase family protein n=1 Tax=Candidatus Thalassospirochaeta sargassi TaxID=3119039 RepID=A0AAJ1IBX3_9SPIO|nr:patatin-like phospholipase family protein [Spirochaetales bacterium]